jgi:hypothetical protein
MVFGFVLFCACHYCYLMLQIFDSQIYKTSTAQLVDELNYFMIAKLKAVSR